MKKKAAISEWTADDVSAKGMIYNKQDSEWHDFHGTDGR